MRLRTPGCKVFIPNLWHTVFTAVWCKEATNNAPDAISHYPIWQPRPADILAKYEPSIAEIRVLAEGSLQESTRKQELRKQASEDGEYKQLRGSFCKAAATLWDGWVGSLICLILYNFK